MSILYENNIILIMGLAYIPFIPMSRVKMMIISLLMFERKLWREKFFWEEGERKQQTRTPRFQGRVYS
jgi:hypothetical protein